MSGGRVVHEHAEFLGVHTNNYAEYRGLIAAINKAIELGADEAEFVMDSQLVIRQMTGEYRVKNPDMAVLHADAEALAALIPKVSAQVGGAHTESRRPAERRDGQTLTF